MRRRFFRSPAPRRGPAGRTLPSGALIALLAMGLALSTTRVSRAAGGPSLPDLDPVQAAAAAAAARSHASPAETPAIGEPVDPATYRVGPGDEFAFRASDLADPKTVRVGPTGELILPDAGAIAVSGLTLRELEAHVRETLRPYIRGKGFLLTLQRPRRFRAVVAGEVERPGAVEVQAPVRASDVIEAAGGVTWRGARRGILLLRDGDSLVVDLVRYERSGDRAANPLVFETDILVVPASSSRIRVGGAVAAPGEYDFAPGDRASTLLAAAGGLLARAASDRITLSREREAGRREERAVLASGGAAAAADDDPLLEPGDQIFVPERAHWGEGSHVVVEGEVALPGPYAITDGADRLGDLLRRAGGFTEWADSAAMRVRRKAGVTVRDSAFLRLAHESEAILSSSERDYVITVAREREALSLSAGSWGDAAGARRSWREIALLDGDRVVVPRRVLTVMVQGEVKIPGHVPYTPGRGVADYVRGAGGYTSRASKGRVRVTPAATGRPVGARDVRELQAGDVVWVPARDRQSFWGTMRDFLTTAAQAATIYLVVREATR